MPQALPWNSLKARSICALMRPTTRPSRRARNSSASPCLKNGPGAPVEEQLTLDLERGNPLLRVRVQPERELDEFAHVPARGDGRYLD